MNTKMQKMLRGNPYISSAVSVLASVLAVSGIVYAATTIGTNVTVDGTLTQTGAATFSGAATFNGSNTFGDAAADTNLFTGMLQASTTALFTGAVTHYGNSTFGDAAADVNLFTGTLQASTTALFTNGLTAYATSTLTGVTVGGSGTAFTQLVAGFCNIPDTAVTASSTDFADCAGATGIAKNDRVFVMATGSLPTNLVIRAASSSANNTINVEIFNTGLTPNTNTTGNISFNFWAFK